jgi:hypothetical protein
MAENAGLLIMLAVGAYYFLSTSKGTPVFKNANGAPITTMMCGNTMTFDVPGYTRVWMSQLKNGVLNFDGPFDLPMPPYIATCSGDVGVYDVAVYELDANENKGQLIGQTRFTITPQA